MTWPPEPRSRREFLGGSARVGAYGLALPLLLDDLLKTTIPARPAPCAMPQGFPAGVPLGRKTFENWARDLRGENIWTVVPRTPDDVVAAANWAHAAGWKVRPIGYMHGWSPFSIVNGTKCDDRVLLIDTTKGLTSVSVTAGAEPSVRAGAGASLDAVATALGNAGLGFTNTPAPGDITVGGMLAVGAHGSSVPAVGEPAGTPGRFGSMSGRVLEVTVVAWDAAAGRYGLRTISTSTTEGAALQTALGRVMVVEAVLRAEPDVNLRCLSLLNVPAAELFGTSGRTFSSYLDEAGRVEVIWFPFTKKPWLKVWSVSPQKPASSRAVTAPYPYPFSDNIPTQISVLAEHIIEGNQRATPLFGTTMYAATTAGLAATASADIWGPARMTQLYIKPTTLRVAANGYAVLTNRSNVQRVLAEFYKLYQRMVGREAARGRYPIGGPIEIRVTGLDEAGVAGPGAPGPLLSPIRARPDRPDWNVAVWLDVLSFPGAPGSFAFYREFERKLARKYDGSWALMRPEWSKGWGYTSAGPHTSPQWLDGYPASTLRDGYSSGGDWDAAVAALQALDPHGVFTNAFSERVVA